MRSISHWDKKQRKMVKGYPPQFIPYGQAPIYKSDVMRPTVHPATGKTIESRNEWALTDAVNGCETVHSTKELQTRVGIVEQGKKKLKKEVSEDRKKAMKIAQEKLDTGKRKIEKVEHPEYVNELINGALNGTE